MTQHIGIVTVNESNEIVNDTGLNCNGIIEKALSDPKSYPWLSSIDGYGTTWINKLQSIHVIAELEQLDLPDADRKIANSVIETLQKLESLQYARFDGD